jgi:hypothetical protein
MRLRAGGSLLCIAMENERSRRRSMWQRLLGGGPPARVMHRVAFGENNDGDRYHG